MMDEPHLDGLRTNGVSRSGPDAVAHLEAQVNGIQAFSEG